MTEGEPVSKAPLTALIVDPDADTRELYAFCLGRENWAVMQAESGDDGYARAVQMKPDVVITELAMPGVDGFELCRRLRREPATREIPLVVVTASAFARDVERATKAGSDVVVCKPCLPGELVALLSRVLEKSRALRARSREARERAHEVTNRANALIEKSQPWNDLTKE